MALRARQWGLPALLLLAVLLRVITLGDQSLWLDEAATATAVHQKFKPMLIQVGQIETTPALYYAATWAWTHVFGYSDFMMRAVSCLAGLALIPVALAYGRRLAGERAGWTLAAISTVHPLTVWYSQEARSYSLALLFGSLAWLAFLRVLDEPKTENVIWWALAAGAGAVTHYTLAYFAVVQGLWMFWACSRMRRQIVVAAGALALVGLAMAPLAAAVDDARTGWIKFIPLGNRLDSVVRDGLAGPSLPTWHPAAFVAVLVGLAAAPVLLRSDRKRILLPAALAFAAGGVALLMREAGNDYVLPRNLIDGYLPVWGVVAAGLAWLPRSWMTAAGATALCALLLGVTVVDLSDNRQQRPDWKAVAQAIGPAKEPRVIVGTAGFSSRPLSYYLPAVERLPGQPWAATDVVLVTPKSASYARPCGGGAMCGLYPGRAPDEPVKGLRKVSERVVARFRIVTYRARRPVAVDDGTLPLFGQQDYGGGPTLAFRQG